MGDTLNRGLRPARRGPLVLPLPGNVQQWKAMAMQRLGWESRTGLQTTTKAGLDDAAERVLDRGLRGQGPFAAATTAKLRKGAGDDFKTYHDLQTAFESAQDRPPEMVAELRESQARLVLRLCGRQGCKRSASSCAQPCVRPCLGFHIQHLPGGSSMAPCLAHRGRGVRQPQGGEESPPGGPIFH